MTTITVSDPELIAELRKITRHVTFVRPDGSVIREFIKLQPDEIPIDDAEAEQADDR